MAFAFKNQRAPKSFAELTALQQKQLATCGKRYDGKSLPAAKRYQQFSREHLELWDVLDDATPAYDAWIYVVDSGTIFEAGTTKVAAEIIQFDFKSKDPLLAMLLQQAWNARKKSRAR
jgi:hypothetical protein